MTYENLILNKSGQENWDVDCFNYFSVAVIKCSD